MHSLCMHQHRFPCRGLGCGVVHRIDKSNPIERFKCVCVGIGMAQEEEQLPINIATIRACINETEQNGTMPKRFTSKNTFPIVTIMTCIAILKSLLHCLLLDPLVWLYTTVSHVICCCFAPSSSAAAITASSSSTSTTEGSASFYCLQGDWVVHERQSLQLCAVHTINNLLQLTHDDRDLPWTCGNRVIRWTSNTNHDATSTISSSQPSSSLATKLYQKLPAPASQVELDRIACDLMRAEDALLDRQNNDYSYYYYYYWRCLPSRCCRSWNNTHRTLYYGNYSFETLEVALQRRYVSLEWFHIPASLDDLLRVPAGIVVGFIINHVMNDENGDDDHRVITTTTTTDNNNNCSVNNRKLKSFRRSVWKKCCDDPGRHWYAITRVRRQSNGIVNHATDNNNNNSNNISVLDDVANEETPDEDRWKILDSDRMGEATILRTDQVREYLQQLSNQDATIFRATLILP